MLVAERMESAKQKDLSSFKALKRVKQRFREQPTRVARFLILSSPLDPSPTVVEQVLGEETSVEEVFWNFRRLQGNQRITLKQNPYFYKGLPKSARAYNHSFTAEPIENFQDATEILVLLDQQSRVFLEAGEIRRVFGNFWVPDEAIIFKDIHGRLEGERVVVADIQGAPHLWIRGELSITPPPAGEPNLSSPADPLWNRIFENLRQLVRGSLDSPDVSVCISTGDTPPESLPHASDWRPALAATEQSLASDSSLQLPSSPLSNPSPASGSPPQPPGPPVSSLPHASSSLPQPSALPVPEASPTSGSPPQPPSLPDSNPPPAGGSPPQPSGLPVSNLLHASSSLPQTPALPIPEVSPASGGTTSATPSPPPQAHCVSPPPQSNIETIELQEGLSPPVPPPRGRLATLGHANSAQPAESILASQNSPPTSGSSHVSRSLSRTTSAAPYDSPRLPVSEEETSQNPLLESDKSNALSSSRRISRARWAPKPFMDGGHSHDDERTISTVRDPRTDPRSALELAIMRGYNTRRLLSTVWETPPEDFKFRILVVGKSRSGKSSLIKTVFKVDVAAAPERALGENDINFEYCPEDNRYLIVHECSGLESRAGDSQNFLDIRDFILHRTDTNCSASERLHAVWICVPASDAIAGDLGEGVEEILGMETVPVILVFTKFDVLVSDVLHKIAGGDAQQYELARAAARQMCEGSCRRSFDKSLEEVPAETVSGEPGFADLVENLVLSTDRFILGSRSSSAGFGDQEGQTGVSAVPHAWSAALRVSHNIVLQASIEVGRNRYWHRLWANVYFINRSLKSCVNIIHVDLVETWNLNDRTRYLSSDEFKAKMSHLVKDLARSRSLGSDSYLTRAEVGFANWVHGLYKGGPKDVRCLMGYIVNLMAILDTIFNTIPDDVSLDTILLVIQRHVDSGHKNGIHQDIREFVTAFADRFSVLQTDIILERIIDLVQKYCDPPTRNR
ncbi:hypothetical protein EI94DRAFT_1738614 [Lactarius quietus]|nr:hypothetical protein EI94DRAFT_1738614 [Lactarius quietus]